MLDKQAVINMARRYASEVEKLLHPQAVILFGSHAKGTANEDSDIDIAIVIDGFTGNYLEVSKQLYKLRRSISADIEPVLLDSAHDDSGFVAEVFRTGQILSARPMPQRRATH